jgi:hypothetical protein
MIDGLRTYRLQVVQGVGVAICIGLVVLAARAGRESTMTLLLLMSLGGGGLSAAWIFHTSAAGKKTRVDGTHLESRHGTAS